MIKLWPDNEYGTLKMFQCWENGFLEVFQKILEENKKNEISGILFVLRNYKFQDVLAFVIWSVC